MNRVRDRLAQVVLTIGAAVASTQYREAYTDIMERGLADRDKVAPPLDVSDRWVRY